MKTKVLTLSAVSRSVIVLASALIGFMAVSMLAHADAPSLTAVARTSAGSTITSAPIGTNVYVNALVASSSTTTIPVGSVDFLSYNGTSCQGNATLQAGVNLTSGTATSSAIAVPAAGLSYKVHYSGDAFNSANDTACQSVTATAAGVSITAPLSTTTAVLAGTSVTQSATLSGATANAGGSVAYNVYSNNSCTTLWQAAGTKTVTNAAVAASDAVAFNIAGSYWWQAVYSGDVNNTPATSSCNALSVIATSTPSNPNAIGVISGTVYNDLNKNRTLNSGEAGIAGVTINLYKGAGWWGKNGMNNPVATVVTDANGNYSFTGLVNGIYSVEQIKKAGYKQISDDFRLIRINSNSFTTAHFANIAAASSTNNGHHHNNNDDDNDDHGNKGGKGNHWGWFKNFRGSGHR